MKTQNCKSAKQEKRAKDLEHHKSLMIKELEEIIKVTEHQCDGINKLLQNCSDNNEKIVKDQSSRDKKKL
jgi:hypothetical protein